MARRDTAARRYAEAGFQTAREARALDAWERDLARLRELLGDAGLQALVTNPAVPYADKERVMRRVAGNVTPEVLNLVLLMVRRGRPGTIGPMADHFTSLLRAHRGVVLAEVRTALPLDEAQDAALRARLAEMTGAAVEINEVVDESLIGGITVRIGDRLYDASVRNRLERLRARLIAV